jgi:hypothetical protein
MILHLSSRAIRQLKSLAHDPSRATTSFPQQQVVTRSARPAEPLPKAW